jgi:hypothetical protein
MNNDHPQQQSGKDARKKPNGLVRRVARAVIEKGLVAYYVGTDPATPRWAKAVLVAAVGSFFSVDLLADVLFLPVGIELSLGSIVMAVGAFLFSLRKHHFQRARDKVAQFFHDESIIEVEIVTPPPVPPEAKVPPLLPKP